MPSNILSCSLENVWSERVMEMGGIHCSMFQDALHGFGFAGPHITHSAGTEVVSGVSSITRRKLQQLIDDSNLPVFTQI